MAIKKFIDSTGLAALWEKIKALYATKTELDGKANSSHSHNLASSTASGFMSSGDKLKLDGIASGANRYVLPVATSSAIGGVKSGTDITVDSSGNVSVNDNSHNHFYERGVFYGASGVAGYVNFCTITVNSQHLDETFSMDLSSRSRYGTLIINLLVSGSSTNISAPVLYWISDIHLASPVYYKVDSNKLYLYWQKSEAYDEMSVTGLNIGSYTCKGVTFSWGNTYVTSNTGLTNVSKIDNYVNCIELGSSTNTTYTIDSMWVDLQNKVGSTGSVYLNKKASGVGSGIATGWYNFIYMPHRSGVGGGDNNLYGSIILTPMAANDNTTSWVLRVQNSATTVTSAVKLTNYSIADISGLQAALDGKSSTSHSHGLSTNNFYQLLDNTTTDSGQSMVGVTNSSNFNLVKAVHGQQSAPAWFQPDHSSGIAFGGGDTKGIMSMRYQLPSIRFAGGNGSTFKWNMTISGTSGTTYDLSTLATKTELASRLNKRCGWCVTNVATPYWFMIAGFTCTSEWFDLNTTFIASRNFYGQSAIITATIRQTTMGSVETCVLSCISKNESFPIDNLAIAYKGTSGSKSEFQIWAKCSAQYQSMSIMPLYQGTRDRISNSAEYWTLNQVTQDHTVYRAAVNSDGLFTHPNGFTIKLCTGPEYATKTNLTDGSVTKVGTATLGSTTKPIYLSSGVPTTGSTYAGGTRVTLNSTSKAGSTATFYAPTTYGSNGHVLIAKGSGNAPTFTDALQISTSGSSSSSYNKVHLYKPLTYRRVHEVQANSVAEFNWSYSSACVYKGATIVFNKDSNYTTQLSVIPVWMHEGSKITLDECNDDSTSNDGSFSSTRKTYTARTSGIVFVSAWPYVFHLSSHEIFDKTLVINSLSDSRFTLVQSTGLYYYIIDLSSDNILYDSIVFDIPDDSYPSVTIGSIKMNNIPNCHVVRLYAKNGTITLSRLDTDYSFAVTPGGNSYHYINRNCYTEVMWYGNRWLTRQY